jgi:hypothetical protein
LLVSACFLIWRIFIFENSADVSANVNVGNRLEFYRKAGLLKALVLFSTNLIRNLFNSAVFAWFVPTYHRITARGAGSADSEGIAIAALCGLLSATLVVVYHRLLKHHSASTQTAHADRDGNGAKASVVIGAIGTAFALAPATWAQYTVRLGTPQDRYVLPAIIPIAILVSGLVSMLDRKSRVYLLASLVGLSVGAQAANGYVIAKGWQEHRDVWWQLSWRAPQIEPGTSLILTNPHELESEYVVWGIQSYQEIYAPLYLIYDYGAPNHTIYGTKLNESLAQQIRNGEVESQLPLIDLDPEYSNLLLVTVPDDISCLRVLDGTQSELFANTSSLVQSIAPYSNIERIEADAAGMTPPRRIFDREPRHTWCYYFQRAELARQAQEWERLARLGDEVQELGYRPKDSVEWLPFIEGYANVGRCADAMTLYDILLKQSSVRVDFPGVCWEQSNAMDGLFVDNSARLNMFSDALTTTAYLIKEQAQ